MPEINQVEVRILDYFESPSATASRFGKIDVVVRYIVDNMRQYQLIIPKEEATPAEVEKRIRASETERKKVIGLTFKV